MASRESSLRHRTAQQKEPLLTHEDDHTEPKKARRKSLRLQQELFTNTINGHPHSDHVKTNSGLQWLFLGHHLGHHLHLHVKRAVQLAPYGRWSDSSRLLYPILQDLRTQRGCVSVLIVCGARRSEIVFPFTRIHPFTQLAMPLIETMRAIFLGSMRFILESSPRITFAEATFSMSTLHSPR